MEYPTQANIVNAENVTRWIDDFYLRLDPFAFPEGSFPSFARVVAETFDVEKNGVYCVGSGAVGLSLDHDKIVDGRLKSFDGESDIDLAVISAHHFDIAWRDLRKATQPHLAPFHSDLERVRRWQRKRLFDGVILAHLTLQFLSFGSQWLAATTNAGTALARVMNRDIDLKIFLYRDYWSLRNYVSEGVVKCQKRLREGPLEP